MTGSCAVCGQPFTTMPAQRPARRYCSTRCRKTAWRRRHPRPGPVPADVPRPGDVAQPVPRPDHAHGSPRVRAEPVTRCPHCAAPVAVITLLVTPAAAQVNPPGARHG
jgi:endogenous inhibitor of DNA gyrase (YacG/DUF329 family)